jgi:hypothetical protein
MRYAKKGTKIDGYVWICKLPCIIFRLMYKYINNLNIGDIAHELNIGKITVTGYPDFARTLIVNYIITSNDKIGGYDQPKYVEIDESLF